MSRGCTDFYRCCIGCRSYPVGSNCNLIVEPSSTGKARCDCVGHHWRLWVRDPTPRRRMKSENLDRLGSRGNDCAEPWLTFQSWKDQMCTKCACTGQAHLSVLLTYCYFRLGASPMRSHVMAISRLRIDI